MKEIAIMRTLEEHPNTVKLFDVYDQSDTFVLVMELCSGEDHVEGEFRIYALWKSIRLMPLNSWIHLFQGESFSIRSFPR